MATINKARGHGGASVFYDRLRNKDGKQKERMYHVFGLCRVVFPTGESFWRLIIGPWAIAFGYKGKGVDVSAK